MIINTNQVNLTISKRYPYDYRVEVLGDPYSGDKVSDWLEENKIPHTTTGWGVYYMQKEHVSWLILRWAGN
jgi:hypothetical protein